MIVGMLCKRKSYGKSLYALSVELRVNSVWLMPRCVKGCGGHGLWWRMDTLPMSSTGAEEGHNVLTLSFLLKILLESVEYGEEWEGRM